MSSLKLSSTVFGANVAISRSGEAGTITGFCQYKRSKSKQFFVEFTSADGCAREAWFYEDELTVI